MNRLLPRRIMMHGVDTTGHTLTNLRIKLTENGNIDRQCVEG